MASDQAMKTLLKNEIRINCPECDDTKYHMYVNLDKMVYICHKCGARGRVDSESNDITKYKKVLSNTTGRIDTSKPNITSKLVRNLPYNESVLGLPERDKALMYLHKRGITKEDMAKYDIRVSLDLHGPYSNTIIFPIRNGGSPSLTSDPLEYFVCRKWDGSKPKYINAPWPKAGAMFINGEGNRIPVFVEGIFDAIAVSKLGYTGIALLGKIPTSQQLYRINHMHFHKALVYLDHDAFCQSITLSMLLKEMGFKTRIIDDKMDASERFNSIDGNLKQLLDSHAKTL